MRLSSDSKLAFYKTNYRECLRLLSIIGQPYLSTWKEKEIEKFLGTGFYNEIRHKSMMEGSCRDNAYFDACLGCEGGLNFINEVKPFSFSWNIESGDGFPVVFDGFCGESEWLSTFNSIKDARESFCLVGNEIEDGRFNKSKKLIGKSGYVYHGSFEELDFPQESVSVMLFNPPYGSDGDTRNALKYLNMTLERNLFVKCDPKNYYKKHSIFISVLTGDDTLLCLPTIIKHFDIKAIWRVEDEEEYQKFKQFLLIGELRESVYPDNYNDLIQQLYDRWSKVIINEEHFKFFDYGCLKKDRHYIPRVDIKTLLSNHEYKKNKEQYISSPNSSAFNWAKEMTRVKIDDFSSLTMPKAPKPSEIAILIAAGTINGVVSQSNDFGKHIAVGGVRVEVKKIEEKEKDESSGDTFTITKTIKQSVPYLNVLFTDKSGNIILKELA